MLYLILTEGCAPSDGSTTRDRLARVVTAETSDEPEARGLLALRLPQHSRRGAQFDADGGLVTLEYQDRSLWDRGLIAEGVALVRDALRGLGRVVPWFAGRSRGSRRPSGRRDTPGPPASRGAALSARAIHPPGHDRRPACPRPG
ncbi:DUF6596 domain-containing protein [Streptomyces sp. NPDC057074]|uniref:DUF6596 domain-containing protein n=1 Tax=Streptomyces sp. NPDC057074 TaxID=3346015 RepID=UPI00362E3397